MFERMKESLATRLVDGPPQTRDHRPGPSGQATPIANRACEWPNTTQCSPFRRCAPFRHRHRLPLVRPPVPHCTTLHQIAPNRSNFERPLTTVPLNPQLNRLRSLTISTLAHPLACGYAPADNPPRTLHGHDLSPTDTICRFWTHFSSFTDTICPSTDTICPPIQGEVKNN